MFPLAQSALRESPSVFHHQYFSHENVDFIHDVILDTIEKAHGIRLDPQNKTEIQLELLRSFDHAKADPVARAQLDIATLNRKTIDVLVDRVDHGIRKYAGYYKAASTMPLMDRNPEIAGAEYVQNDCKLGRVPVFGSITQSNADHGVQTPRR